LRTLFDLIHELFLLSFQLDFLLIDLTYRFIEETLVLAQTLRRRQAFAESPFQDLARCYQQVALEEGPESI